ncbi:MAG TPA: hypothetical protein VFW92_03635 [Candidatus Limnocylindrales bacterium]|nr:hypothetical protein [Candidatus Limnocylindrales bacterium]
MSSNVGQNYPSGSETQAQRAANVEAALKAFDGLRDKVAAETTPLGEPTGEWDASGRWWVWVCTAEPDFKGRLHVAGYARDRHAVYVVCDTCGTTFLR